MPTSSVGGPLPTEARQGRQNQKYGESGERLIAGCIPFRVIDAKDVQNGVEVLLVTRRNGNGWVLPKGGWESDEDVVETAALRETVEEAGVRGDLEEPILGIFKFNSKKRQNYPVNTCLAHVFAMKVVEVLDAWPEQTFRKRRWFSVYEAYNCCMEEWMREALRVWIERNNWTPSPITNGIDIAADSSREDKKEETKPPETAATH